MSNKSTKIAWLRLVIYVLISTLFLVSCTVPGGSSQVTDVPVATDTPQAEPTNTPVAETDPAPTVTPKEETDRAEASASTAAQTFVIVGEESEARFIIDELLFGAPKTVIGTTSELSGELTVNAANPSASEIGPIQVDANTFITDNNRRNGAIQRFILQTSRYKFITFTPTAISGMPDAVSIGDEVSFDVSGDLTIRDITNPVSFTVTLQVVSESELQGVATTVIAREAYALTIPQVPSVANVSEEVIVEFDFVARAE